MNLGNIDMGKVRDLAQTLGIPSKELEIRLQDLGISNLTFSSSTIR